MSKETITNTEEFEQYLDEMNDESSILIGSQTNVILTDSQLSIRALEVIDDAARSARRSVHLRRFV